MHTISIPTTVSEAIAAQRGRLWRYDHLDPSTTALLVIDLQNAFLVEGMPIEVPCAREIVPNVNRLARAFRHAGGSVVWIQMTLSRETDQWSTFFDGDSRDVVLEALTCGAFGHALYAGLDVEKGDAIVEKSRYSAFIQGASDLDELLKGRAADTVVIAGTLTNVCCESTARDAMMLNYRVVLVSDATATTSDEAHNAALATVFQSFGDVRSTDEVTALLAPYQSRSSHTMASARSTTD